MPGEDVFHMAYDSRGDVRTYAAVNSMWFGLTVQFSDDFGQTWEQPEIQPAFPSHRDMSVYKVWHLEPGRSETPGELYLGADPSSLFKSEDRGVTWHELESFGSHPTRDQWQPDLGGLCLHSIVMDSDNKDRMWLGASAVGVFRTDGGGATWQTRNKGVRADFLPDRFPDFGQ